MPRPHLIIVLVALGLTALVWPAPAFAYIDPGTGSFVIQGIIAAVVGAGVAVRMFWGRIKGALTGRRADADQDDDV